MKVTATAPAFEIRIAVLGYVSAGKTTVINALLRDKYGQVGMRRTTAGVNYFRLHHHPQDEVVVVAPTKDVPAKQKTTKKAKLGSGSNETVGKAGDDMDAASASIWVVEGEEEEECVTAKEALREISEDNKKLRESPIVNVKTFDIAVNERLCQVRPDTRLVLIDIPGINEAGADGKYRAYVREHWDTFDCVLVVMDGRHGANTEEQVKLMEFVRDNNRDRKDIPTIIVCNKVDDPDDQEQAELVREAKEEVEKIFAVKGSQQKQNKTSSIASPRFVPTSAEFAYIYRTAALMSYQDFLNFDKDLVDRLGRKEVGWRFTKRSPNEKYRLAYQAVTDMELFDERIQATNFDVVLQAIKDAVGGSDTQLRLIQMQIDVALRRLSHKSNFVDKIRDVFYKRQALGQATDDLPLNFWSTYHKSEEAAFRSFAESPTGVEKLAKPMKELADYDEFAKTQGLKDECNKCVSRFKGFVVRQIGVVLSKEAMADADWLNREPTASVQWGTLHPIDWVRLLQSILLVSQSKVFYERLGRELMLLEEAKHRWMAETRTEPSLSCKCPSCTNASLDFNGFCSACNIFTNSTECAVLKEFAGPTKCRRCSRIGVTSSGYCDYGGTHTVETVRFVTSTSAALSPFKLLCPKGNCDMKLTANRVCVACRAMYCLKDSPRCRNCIFCSAQLQEGRCTSKTCGGNKLAWRELPFASIREALVWEYDPQAGAIMPKYPEIYKSAVKLDVPAVLSDPNHMGHVSWTYCQFVESNESAP